MISDVLSEAVEEIRRYQKEMPKVYGQDKALLDDLVSRMEAVRVMYDRVPGEPQH